MTDPFADLLKAEEQERSALTLADYAAAGEEPPHWDDEPIPSLVTWRRWQAAQDKALAHKRATAREANIISPEHVEVAG